MTQKWRFYEPGNTINLLKNAGLFEISHITSFECCRTAKDGNVQSLIVEIFDGVQVLTIFTLPV
jgi:hypothetical protein